MAFPKGLLGEGYLELSEPDRTALKIKYNIPPKAVFHRDFPMKQYEKLDLAGKNELRAKWHMVPLAGIGHEGYRKPGHDHKGTPLTDAGHSRPAKKTAWAEANEAVEAVFPRSTDGAVKFIRAWNKAKDGNAFVAEHGKGNPEFWSACTHRATYLRKKGVQLKVLKKTKGDDALYDWDLLKQVAAENGD